MRFLVMVKATPESEAGQLPTREMMQKMGAFNQELVKAGMMLSGEGLAASSQGARINFSAGKPSVIDGPFAETKELVAGFWILQGNSLEEIVEWISRAPFERNEQIEIRRIQGPEDYAEIMNEGKAS